MAPDPNDHTAGVTPVKEFDDLDLDTQIYYCNIRDRYPHLPAYLKRRLARANHQRYKRLKSGLIETSEVSICDKLTTRAARAARQSKTHLPPACVNCHRKHLACETKRPCNRCVQTGKSVRLYKSDLLKKVLLNPSRRHALTSSARSSPDQSHAGETLFARQMESSTRTRKTIQPAMA